MGNLKKARQMATWNFATFQWLESADGVRNQMEHGGYSLGWLAMLHGDFETAKSLFMLAEKAWEGHEGKRGVFFQYYPVYFSEMYLIEGNKIEQAETILNEQLDQAQEHGWLETEARCHIFTSMVQRHRARRLKNKEANLRAAIAFCKSAEECLKKVFAPPVEIELLSELLCVYFELPTNPNFLHNGLKLLKRFENRVESLEWGLYRSEQYAFKGMYFELKGNQESAIEHLNLAEHEAKRQGNMMALLSPFRPISMLRSRLKIDIDRTQNEYNGTLKEINVTNYKKIFGADLAHAVSNDFITQPIPTKIE